MTGQPISRMHVHMIGRVDGLKLNLYGEDVVTLCFKSGSPTAVSNDEYTLTAESGNVLRATTTKTLVTCTKCKRAMTK